MSQRSRVRRSLLLAALAAIPSVLAAAQQPPAAAQPSGPAKGDLVPAFETLGIDGRPHKVDFPKGSKTVLLFFLSGCPHCHRMMPEWNRAYQRRPKQLEVLGVIMDQEPPGFWSTMPVSFPVLRSPGHGFLSKLNVKRAPLALRVGEGGRIEDVAPGETDLIRLGEIFKP